MLQFDIFSDKDADQWVLSVYIMLPCTLIAQWLLLFWRASSILEDRTEDYGCIYKALQVDQLGSILLGGFVRMRREGQ